MNQLPKRQQEVFDFIRKEVKEKGFSPTLREIGEAVGLASSSTVQGHLARLEKKGLIMCEPSKPQALTILHSEEENV